MDIKIDNGAIAQINGTESPSLPRYTSGLINLANQTCQATRPSKVGQMSEIVADYIAQAENPDIEGWKQWHNDLWPDSAERASEAIYGHIEKLREALDAITPELVSLWVEDLLFNKTFGGLYVQPAVLAAVADALGLPHRGSTPAEEARGIDGYIGQTPVSVKPASYAAMGGLNEAIAAPIIRYEKTKKGLTVSFDETRIK